MTNRGMVADGTKRIGHGAGGSWQEAGAEIKATNQSTGSWEGSGALAPLSAECFEQLLGRAALSEVRCGSRFPHRLGQFHTLEHGEADHLDLRALGADGPGGLDP